MPGALMVFSPWLDMVTDYEHEVEHKKVIRPNEEIDLLSTAVIENLRFLGHHPTSLLWSPYLTSNRAPKESYIGHPKIFISIGDAEEYQRECEQLADQMRGGGVDVTLDVQKDAVHHFFGMALPVIPSEVARAQVLENVKAWLQEHATTTE
ncbi:hypothetical protein DFS33DRAFT_1376775 [Desarmillaria ectypa]|nr:hypothetical protein DFS33DRAFT_1376775 [Desarmillaria ectypa]